MWDVGTWRWLRNPVVRTEPTQIILSTVWIFLLFIDTYGAAELDCACISLRPIAPQFQSVSPFSHNRMTIQAQEIIRIDQSLNPAL